MTRKKNAKQSKTASASKNKSGRPSLRVLFTCVGRRIELLDAFRRAAEKLKIDLKLHGADMSLTAPAMHRVDHAHILPKIRDPDHIDNLVKLIAQQKIDLVIPLIDSDLVTLAESRERIERAGATLVLSSAEVVRTCRDKLASYRKLVDSGIDTPRTWTWQEASSLTDQQFPYYMKPRFGSAGFGNYRIDHASELAVLGRRVPDAIVQEFVPGVEHTLDVYTGLDGVPRCVVPRRRLEVRTGEVSKAVIVKDRNLIAVGCRVAEALRECRGVVTVQCMVTDTGRIRVIEINPRLGGGAPLSIYAGADFPLWIMAEHLGRKTRITSAAYRNGMVMLRYDQSVFLDKLPSAKRKA